MDQISSRQKPISKTCPKKVPFSVHSPAPETGPSERSDSKMHVVPTTVTATLLLGLVRQQYAGSHAWDDQFLTNYSPQTTLSIPPLSGTIQTHFRLGRAS